MEYIILAAFCILLFGCLLLDISILIALVLGLLLFAGYGKWKGFSFPEVLRFAGSGIRTVKNILITFMLIGIMTALWRAAGTIPMIVCFAGGLIHPSVFLLMTFLLNCLLSVLTGTAFGTAATMGVICSTMGASMGVSPILVGGAVLSGVFFGDRCSPVSTSALLVAAVTGTDIFANIKKMIRTAVVPFAVTCLLYTVLGIFFGGSGQAPDLTALFSQGFSLSWVTVLPAAILLLLAVLKVNVKLAMLASILTAIPVCIFGQGMGPEALLQAMATGYVAENQQIAAMLNGGGVTSMLKVAAIVCISSAYSGIFQKTGLLLGIQNGIHHLAQKTTPYFAALLTSVVTGMIACNQTLSIMLTDQLCRETQPDKGRFAITLENTAVVTSPLIPWSIAGAVPLASVGAPTASLLFACFLYLLPLWSLIRSKKER